MRIPFAGEIEAAFLHPSLEIFGGDAIGKIENRIVRLENFHRLLFHADALASNLQGKRREVSVVEIGKVSVVLRDQSSAGGDEIQQALVVRFEVVARVVGADAKN